MHLRDGLLEPGILVQGQAHHGNQGHGLWWGTNAVATCGWNRGQNAVQWSSPGRAKVELS